MFKKMDYVYEIYRTGSFSKAASNLFISQPALSIAVRKLEEDLGQKLFARTTSAVELTEAGKAYIARCEQIMLLEEDLKSYYDRLNGLLTGHVSIGAANISMNYVLPDIIIAFSSRYPGIHITLQEDSLISLKKMLLDESLDFVIDSNSFTENTFQVEKLFTNEMLYAADQRFSLPETVLECGFTADGIIHDRHMAESAKRISIRETGSIPFLSLMAENEINRRFRMICEAERFEPNTVMTFNQQFTSYQFAKRGAGAAIVGDTIVKAFPDEGNLRYYMLKSPAPFSSREIVIAQKKKVYTSIAATEFKNYILTYFRHLGAER